MHSLINIFGLSLGLLCAILIGLYIQYERNYDRHHPQPDRIYRVVTETHARTPPPLGATMVREFPEVEGAVSMMPTFSGWLMRYEDKVFYESRVFQVGGNLLSLFAFPLVKGNPETALTNPASVVISEGIAAKYFGDDDPLGKRIDADNGLMALTVTGVMRNPTVQSHLVPDFFITPATVGFANEGWDNFNLYTYVLLSPDADPTLLDMKVHDLLVRHVTMPVNGAQLQPVPDIHLYSRLTDETGTPGAVSTLYLLGAIAIFLVIMAAVNFMNLTTARSATRLKEIGMRKVLGADRRQLIGQFLCEALALAVLSGILALIGAILLLPLFNTLSGQAITMDLLIDRTGIAGFLVVVLFTGLLAGSYPAFYLSAFQPLVVLKGLIAGHRTSGGLRRMLVVAQFVIALVLMIGTGILWRQVDYLQNERLGMHPDQVLLAKSTGGEMGPLYHPIRRALKQNSHIIDATRTGFLPGERLGRPSHITRPGVSFESAAPAKTFPVLPGFVETFGLEPVAGEMFNEAMVPHDGTAGKVILTRSAVTALGWKTPEEAVGRRIEFAYDANTGSDGLCEVVGVVNDFQIESMRQPLEPLVLLLWTDIYGGYMYIKVQPQNFDATIGHIEQVWQDHIPHIPFDYTFLDDVFRQMYRTEYLLSRITLVLSLVAILIACLGVLGLTAYMTERRTKEVGIRKVLGASTPNLIRLLSREMLVLVALANMIAWPTVYLIMQRWLQQFAYQIDISAVLFILAGFSLLAMALLTVGYYAVKTARANPVDTLRWE